MGKRNTITVIVISIVFVLSFAVVFPIEKGALGKRGVKLGLDLRGGIHMVYKADLSTVERGKEIEAVEGALAVIERRVNILGVSEPVIQRQGEDRIVVELPGISEVEKAKRLIGQTALLEFREQVTDNTGQTKWVPTTAVIDGKEYTLTSAYFKENTYVGTGQLYQTLLLFEWNGLGSKISAQVTGRLIDKPLAIYLSGEPLLGEDGKPIAPIVRAQITDRGQIEGLSEKEATELSRLLNAGRIPIPLTLIYEQSVSPILGADFVGKSVKAGVIGTIIVMLFMIAYYRVSGVLASLALIFYAILVLALFKLIPVTLNLAGLGGFVLSIGMAVDANVLIFERMKEEIITGRTLGAAIENGFNRAWTAIRDSNVTTFIACGILYWLGSSIVASGPVMSFALTLFIGVAVSMFTAITVTRTLLRLFVGTALAHKTSLFSPYSGRK